MGLPRSIEAGLALVGLMVSAPLWLPAALAVQRDTPGPALFRQTRIGREGRPFTLLKLRTMTDRAVAIGTDESASDAQITAGGDPRVTRVGRWLRRLKLDELPQLWNVVRGDLSLVGPRPEVPRYVDLDDPAWREVLRVRPGLADAATLRLRDEEGLLARVAAAGLGAPTEVYERLLLPWKLERSREHLRRRSALGDLRFLVAVARSIVRPPPPLPLDELIGQAPKADG